jgi:hypothetical protein
LLKNPAVSIAIYPPPIIKVLFGDLLKKISSDVIHISGAYGVDGLPPVAITIYLAVIEGS